MLKYLIALMIFSFVGVANAEVYKITGYCPCYQCCHKTDGITASGIQAHKGIVACNHYDFGKFLDIEGIGIVKVEDRGSKKHFGTMKRIVKHIDVFFPTHRQALNFGVRYLNVMEVKN